MTQRRLLLLAATICVPLAMPFAVRWATTPAPGVTLENFRRMHAGMRMDEVEAIMGRSADERYVGVGGVFHIWNDERVAVQVRTFSGLSRDNVIDGWARSESGNWDAKLAGVPDNIGTEICQWLGLSG